MKGEIFPYKQIMEYLTREETSFATLKAFFRSTEEAEKKSAQTILEFTREMSEIAEMSKHKSIGRIVNNFTIHKMEHEHATNNVRLMEQKINFYLTDISSRIKSAKDKTKNMQRVKETLKPSDIDLYKKELTQDLTTITQLREAVINLFCYTMLKNNSQQLQTTTNLIQNQKKKSTILKKQK